MTRRTGVATALIIAFVSAPTAIVLVSSFNDVPLLAFPPTKPSLAPYGDLFSSATFRAAMLRSLLVGVEAALLCLIIGLPTCLGLMKLSNRTRAVISGFLTLGFAAPLAVSAVAFVIVYYNVGVFGSLWSLGVALAIVNFPFFLYAVAASVEALDPRLEEAARTLGAEEIQTFLFVTFPGLAPGVLTGTLLVFIFGITDFLVSLILTVVNSTTLPVVIYGSLRTGPTPMLAAAGGIYVLLAVGVLVAITRLRGLERFLYRND
jgi:putative spermidine/putrescine transport system permease protein